MCEHCGCSVTDRTDRQVVSVLEGLLADNDHRAAHNRGHFDEYGVLAVNLMSSPGAGKTALLEATIDVLRDRYRIAVVEGDLETDNDAERIRRHGVEAIQITTGNACHLDAAMVHDALHDLRLEGLDLLFIENVGNLVCPASFDLGQHLNVTLLSVPEGDDKPQKYPVIFRVADAVLLTKTDLLPVLTEFDPTRATTCVRRLANACDVIEVSARSGEGMDRWLDWLSRELDAQRTRRIRGETRRPATTADGAHLHLSERLHAAG
jgi:hydrogenase nickel incorporation protein HypB